MRLVFFGMSTWGAAADPSFAQLLRLRQSCGFFHDIFDQAVKVQRVLGGNDGSAGTRFQRLPRNACDLAALAGDLLVFRKGFRRFGLGNILCGCLFL